MGNAMGMALRMSAAPLVMGSRWLSHLQTTHEGVPAARWNASLLSKALLDEIFFITELISAELLTVPDRRLVAREILKSLDLYDAQGWLKDPASYHREPPPIEEFQLKRKSLLRGAYRQISFDSGYEPHPGEPGRGRWLDQEANRTAHAWLLEHSDRPRPWLMCIPGYRMGHPMVDFAAFRAQWLHQTLGLNVAIPVLPLHGPRAAGTRGGDGFFSSNVVDTIHAQAQAVWDVRRLLGWLRQQGATSVGAYGVSLGGYTAALLAALDDELDCVIAGVPAADFLRLMRSQVPPLLRQAASWLGFSLEQIEQLLSVVSPLAMPPRVPRDRRFLYAGLGDRVLSPDHARDLWHHWEQPRIAWYQGGHVSFLWEKEVTDLICEALSRSGLIPSVERKRTRRLPANQKAA